MPGATDNKDHHHTESHKSPCIMSTSEGRASKKAKMVGNESLDGDSSDVELDV